MTKQVQIRRGTDSQHTSFTGAEGEISVNTTNDSVHVHDGTTAGGKEMARADGSNVAFTGGTIDGAVIGGTTPAAGTFTTGDFNTSLNVDGTITSDGLIVDGTYTDVKFKTNQGRLDLWLTDTDTTDGQVRIRGDANTLSFITNTTVGMTIDASQNVDVAGTVTSDGLTIDNNGSIIFNDPQATDTILIGTNDDDLVIRADAGDILLKTNNNSTSVVVDASGNCGIGTDTPDTLLELRGADPILTIRDTNTSSASSNATLRLAETGASDTLDAYWDIKADGGQLQFIDNWNEGGGTGTRVVIDDSGNLLVGKTSSDMTTTGSEVQDGAMRVVASSTSTNLATNSGASLLLANPSSTDGNFSNIGSYNTNQLVDSQINFIHESHSSRTGAIGFSTHDGSSLGEVMRVTSGGNLHVGRTTADSSIAGFTAQGNGVMYNAFAGRPYYVNRLSSDGDIIEFAKDGSTVGSIGTASSDLHIDGLANHSGIRFQADSLIPRLNGSDANNTIDLGYHVDGVATHRFRNLYLGNSVNLAPTVQNALTEIEFGVLNAGTTAYAKIDAANLVNYDTNLRFFTNAASSTTQVERLRITSNGDLLVGTTSSQSGISKIATTFNSTSQYGLEIKDTGAGSTATLIVFYRGSSVVGSITTNGSTTAYNTSSDYRLKENVTDITDGIERVKQLNPSRFNFIADADTTVDGFLAHEVSDIVPEAITGEKDAMRDEEYEVTPAVYEDVVIPAVLDDDGNEIEAERTEQQLVTEAVMGTRSVPDYQGIDQSKLVPLLTAALQEAITKIENLEAKVTALENS